MAEYRPSCVAVLGMRFDTAYTRASDPTPTSSLDGPVPAGVSPLNTEALFVQEDAQAQTRKVVVNVLSATVELPTPREAARFALSFNWQDLPIDPRLFTAMRADIYLGTRSAEQVARALRGDYTGDYPAVVPLTSNNRLLLGLVDTVSVEHGPSGSIVTVEGRDLRQMFIDSPAPAALFTRLDLRKDIVQVVDQILQLHPAGANLSVRWFPEEWADYTGRVPPSPYSKDGATRVMTGAAGDESKSGSKSEEVTFWGLITNYANLCGAFVYFDGEKPVLRRARSYYQQLTGPTKFQGRGPRTVTDAEGAARTITIPELRYGRDVERVTYQRKLGGSLKARAVTAVGFDTTGKSRGNQRLVEITYPAGIKILDSGNPTSSAITKARNVAAGKQPQPGVIGPGGAVAYTDVIRVPVAGIVDTRQLEEIARSVYEEIGRGEMGGTLETRNLGSFGDDSGRDPDLLKLRPGDALRLGIDARLSNVNAPAVSPLQDAARQSFAARVKELTDKGYSQNVARAIVATEQRGVPELQPIFRVATVRYDYDHATGVRLSADFQTYVEATRANNTAPTVTTGVVVQGSGTP
jgi:hypothetical protein